MSNKTNILFVTGTDTGVGKTTVSCLLLRELLRRDYSLAVMKPVETGCRSGSAGDLYAADAEALRLASGTKQRMEEICAYRFSPPVAPLACTMATGIPIDAEALVRQAKQLSGEVDLLLIEGAGGLLVPITPDFSFADFVKACDAAVCLVVGSKLGAINHALLTIEVMQKRRLPCVGYVLNECTESGEEHFGESSDITARSSNREIIRQLAERYGEKELDFIPYRTDNALRLTDSVISYFGLSK